ncbi:MAG TPA: serine/threonine-protein kinase [Kofleriaceae bacterium]
MEDDLVGAVLDGRYRILAPVASGAMGSVYRAERVKLGRVVAVKILQDALPGELSSRERFEIEAIAMAKLEHPHCAAVLDVGLHEGRPYVVMDFVSGDSLKDLLAAGPLPPARAVEIVRQALSGLAHAHELGIIHRDVKPANIIVGQKAGLGDHVKVLDFGLARLVGAGRNLTTGIVVGTPTHMAPEQIRGEPLDARVDVYAIGVVLFELLAGQLPYRSQTDDLVELCGMHLTAAIPRLADRAIGDAAGRDFGPLEDVVRRALAKARDDRYPSAVAFADALGNALDQAPRPSQPFAAEPSAPIAAEPSAPVAAEPPPPAPAPIPSGSIAARPGPERESSMSRSQSPTPTPRWLGRFPPPRRRTLLVAGGIGAALAIGIVVYVVNRAPPDAAPIAAASPSPGSAGSGSAAAGSGSAADTGPAAIRAILARADELAANGNRDGALDLLQKARRRLPADAQLPFAAGHLYFAKLWWSDGLRAYRDAVRLDPAFRSDPGLIKDILHGFLSTPSYNAELADFLYDVVGPDARPYLSEAASSHPNPQVRARAKAELGRY